MGAVYLPSGIEYDVRLADCTVQCIHMIFRPWHLVVLALAAWINNDQRQIIDYLLAENAVLREKIGKRRILLSNAQRRRLALKGKALGRRGLAGIETLFTPDTILRWHRELIARKWDYSGRRLSRDGRPRIREEIVDLVVKMAEENRTWGYNRIQGALKNVGFYISDSTIGNILKEQGMEPAPLRGTYTRWKTFLRAHWDVMAAADFTSVEVWTPAGLKTYYILIAMKLSSRRIQICGITPNPNAAWVQQVARNLVDCEDGFLLNTRYLILDRDTKFFTLRGVLESTDTDVVLLPPRSPNLNAYMERFMRSLKSECLDKMIFFGDKPLRRALSDFTEHYHAERNHQGIGNKLICPGIEVGLENGTISKNERLGGMLSYYRREAA